MKVKYLLLPVVVMLSIGATSLNAYEPETTNPSASSPQLPKVSNVEDLPEIKAYLEENKEWIIKKIPTTANGKDAIIVYMDLTKSGTRVSNVSLLTSDFKNYDNVLNGKKAKVIPPWVRKIIYHDLGPDKEFGGIETFESRYKVENGRVIQYDITQEYRITDEAVNELLDLSAQNAYKNASGLRFTETKSPTIAEPKITY